MSVSVKMQKDVIYYQIGYLYFDLLILNWLYAAANYDRSK